MTAGARQTGVLAVAGVWWVALAVAFLLGRGEDVGHLPGLVSTSFARLAHGPVWGPAGIQSLIGVLIAGLIGLAWYGLGDAIVRHAYTPSDDGAVDDPVLRAAERSLVGAGAWSLIWFLLGAAPLYRPSVAGLTLLVGLVLA